MDSNRMEAQIEEGGAESVVERDGTPLDVLVPVAVADLLGEDPMGIERLGSIVDVDALNAIAGEPSATDHAVEFTYAEVRVRVEGERVVLSSLEG